MCIEPCGGSETSLNTVVRENVEVYTVWYILSRTSEIPHMVRLGDAPVYYLHVILLIWNILTRTIELISINKLGKICDVM